MKLSFYFLGIVTFAIFSNNVTAQSSNQNYIRTRTMRDNTGMLYSDKIDYFDALGRPVQVVLKGASSSKKDIITLQEYDGIGRESNNWLPISSGGTGAYVEATLFKSAANSFYGDNAPYTNFIYEPSPLERIQEQYGSGVMWRTAKRSVKSEYLTNTSTGNQSCGFYTVMSDNSLRRKGVYATGELFVTKVTDEDNNITYHFINKSKQTLLIQQVNGGTLYDTYFVYDNIDNLRYVLTPIAADALTATASWNINSTQVLKDYAYYYQYDGKNNCILKKLPGCNPVQMKYDKANRLIFSQDGNLQVKSQWTFFLYDVFGRPTVTGIWKSATVPDVTNLVVKTDYTTTGALAGYIANVTLPAVDLLIVNYYDDYSFIDKLPATEKTKMPFVTVSGYDAQYSNVKGLLTGTRTYQLNDVSKYAVSVFYYDQRGRIVQTHSSNHLGGFDDVFFAYTFTGKIKQKQHVHSAQGKTSYTEVYKYVYDHTERLLSVTHKLNAAPEVTLAQYTYDEVGRLKTKKRANETSSYTYNVRNWLTQITGTKFNQNLVYNTSENGLTPRKASYNGNISVMRWKAGNESVERGYYFDYDALNQLTKAFYGEGKTLTTNPNRYDEVITYNRIGDITKLQRQGKLNNGYGLIDNLTYSYNGNRLTKVTDAVSAPITYEGAFHFVDGANVPTEYTYDANGNMTQNLNKKITKIDYNVLNLPSRLQFDNGQIIQYHYDAQGNKLSARTSTQTDYCGNMIYKNGTINSILTEEGYITFSGATPVYHYYLKDHQGNNRVVLHQNGTVEQVNHYYPLGGLLGESIGTSVQPYKYSGKEWNDELGLNLYDFHARNYDPAIGRWLSVDPLAEKYYDISPYTYVANNPIVFVDLDGRQIEPGSQAEWDKQKNAVIAQRDKLQSKIDGLNTKATEKGWSALKLARKIGNMQERVNSLNGTIGNLGALEASDQVYALKSGAGEEGGTTYDPSTGNIVFSYDGTANFVHETTHGGQFESGDIAFDTKTGMPYGGDVFDEVSAYKAQFGYSPSSVSRLTSSSTAKSFGGITTSWVQGITKSDGSKIYAPGGSANTGISPVNMSTNRDGLIKAYPHQKSVLSTAPASFTLKDIPTIYYKK